MKLDIRNHLFLSDVALRLKVEKDRMIDIFNTATISMVKAEDHGRKSIEDFKSGKITQDQIDSEMNTIVDLMVVRAAYDKLSDAYIDAFEAVSNHHIMRAEDHEAQAAA